MALSPAPALDVAEGQDAVHQLGAEAVTAAAAALKQLEPQSG